MYVLNLPQHFVLISNVAVISASGLPETISIRSNANFLQNWRLKLFPSAQSKFGKRTLDSRENLRRTDLIEIRHDDKMNMLWHNNPCTQLEPSPGMDQLKSLCKFILDRVVPK